MSSSSSESSSDSSDDDAMSLHKTAFQGRKRKLAECNGNLLESGLYSDFTIRCGNRTWRVHRSIICPRSKYFTVACNGVFEEGQTKQITLVDDDPQIVEQMLMYLYTFDYDGIDIKENDADDIKLLKPIWHHINVYMVADKYDIADLQKLAGDKFRASLDRGIPPSEARQVLKVVLETTPTSNNPLRDHMVKLCASKRGVKNLMSQGFTLQEWEDVLTLDAGFLLQLVKFMAPKKLNKGVS